MIDHSAAPKYRQTLLYILFLTVCFFALRLGWVIPDGAGYGSYLPSLYLDGDLNFFNQYIHCGIIDRNFIHGAAITGNGYPLNLWTVGTAVVWTPFWLLGHALTYLTSFWGQSWTPNGFTVYYNLGVHFATAWMGFCALFLIAAVARRYVDSRSIIISLALITFGTPFYWYLFHLGDASHVPSSFVIALFLTVFIAFRSGSRTRNTAFLLGLLGGLATIIKPNDILIFLFPLVLWCSEIAKKQSKSKLIAEIGWMALGAVSTILIQLAVWQILFGNPMGPIFDKGVGHYYKFFTGHFWLVDVLFSSYHGLFFFSPVLVFSFWGLFKLTKSDWSLAVPSISILVLQIILMSSERYFWEGAAFGLRRFVDWTPLFTLGLAIAYGRSLRGWTKVFPFLAVLWTVLLYLTYSARPANVLLGYQPPEEILSWIGQTLRTLPQRIPGLFDLPAPVWLFLPALIVCGSLGYILFLGVLNVRSYYLQNRQDRAPSERSRIPVCLTAILLILVLLTYGLLIRAAVNGEASRQRYSRELQWLAKNQETILAAEETEFVLHEGKYLALSRSWDSGRASFIEALRMSPNPKVTAAQIRSFVEQHLPSESAEQYVQSLGI